MLLPFLKPNCDADRIFSFSAQKSSLTCSSFSNVFRTHDNRQIGLYDAAADGSLPGLRMATVLQLNHSSGQTIDLNISLYSSISLSFAVVGHLRIRSNEIPSRPGDELLQLCRVISSSARVNGEHIW